MGWKKVTESVWVFPDSCSVYAVAAPEGMVVINAGTGEWLTHVGELPAPVRALACTHFFRDHSAGAAKAARRGIPVYAPYWEREQFADAPGLFQRRETFIIYDNVWDLYAPIEAIPVTEYLRDGETVTLAGLPLQVVPTPGATVGAVSLLCNLDGLRFAFCGEAIHSPGKLARLAPLQYNYNDLPGAVNAIFSARLLRGERPDVLAPSLGAPILDRTDEALAALEDSLRAALAGRPEYEGTLGLFDVEPLRKVTDHVYQSTLGSASTWFVISKAGKALAIDYGYNSLVLFPGYPYPRNRRPMLHGLEALKERWGIDRLDVVLVTHFHDDHVNGIPTLQRLHGTRCWVGENFADILANPMGYNFPCTWPEPCDVEAQPLGVPIRWEEYEFTLEPISGHTRWSTLISFRADDTTFMATGDQYFCRDWETMDFAAVGAMHNHVYRNGAVLESLHASNAILERVRPEMILPGHGEAYRTDEEFFRAFRNYAEEYVAIHKRAMPLEEEDVHFEVDSRGAWLYPYRARLDSAAPLPYRATVRNPLGTAAEIVARMVGPDGWERSAAKIQVGPHAEVTMELTLTPTAGAVCRRQPVALEVTIDGLPFGQLAEALVTIGHPEF